MVHEAIPQSKHLFKQKYSGRKLLAAVNWLKQKLNLLSKMHAAKKSVLVANDMHSMGTNTDLTECGCVPLALVNGVTKGLPKLHHEV